MKISSTSLTVTIDDPSASLNLSADESYILTVSSSAISISSPTQLGYYHALQTLSQLIIFDGTSYSIPNTPLTISDSPRFSHRGILVDSARHYEPIPTLRRVIDSLTYAKLNVLHWHLVDTQSFPFVSPTYPDLGRMGSFSEQERYTEGDVTDLVEYARKRGVR